MGKKVLLCDDEAHILRAAQIKLSHAGYDVSTAADGQEAWEAILANPPDILVTDLQMPRLDGLELSRRVRETPATSHLPILMLTAKGFELAPPGIGRKMRCLGCAAQAVQPSGIGPLYRHDFERGRGLQPVARPRYGAWAGWLVGGRGPTFADAVPPGGNPVEAAGPKFFRSCLTGAFYATRITYVITRSGVAAG